MDNSSIKNMLDGLTSRGVLSADGRRQIFNILLEQAKDFENQKAVLENDLQHVRQQRDAFKSKLDKALQLVPASKRSQVDA